MRQQIWSILFLTGCATMQTTVVNRFRVDYRCHDVEVKRIGWTDSFLASGCGGEATYTCGSDRVCVRESSTFEPRTQHAPQRDPEAARGQVQRRYDEARKLQIVRVDFEIEPGIALTLLGAPEAKLSDILLQVRAPGYRFPSIKCDKIEILVNGIPAPGTNPSSANPSAGLGLVQQAHFDFQQFKPLGKDFPSFGARVCGWELDLSEEAVVQLKKFLVIFSELAIDVQKTNQPAETKQIEVKSL